MGKSGFFNKKEGKLTIAFLVIMAAFVMMLFGVNGDNVLLSGAGFFMVMLSMLYSPVKTFVLDRKKNNRK